MSNIFKDDFLLAMTRHMGRMLEEIAAINDYIKKVGYMAHFDFGAIHGPYPDYVFIKLTHPLCKIPKQHRNKSQKNK